MNAPYYNGAPEDRHDPDRGGGGIAYICTVCDWHGRGGVAADWHHGETWHPVRGKSWPKDWPNAIFSCCKNGHCHYCARPNGDEAVTVDDKTYCCRDCRNADAAHVYMVKQRNARREIA